MAFLTTSQLFDLSHTLLGDELAKTKYPHEILPRLKELILELGQTLSADEYDHPAEDVWIHRTARVAPTASVSGPTIICAEAEIRHCAFIRGSALIGKNAVVGNSTEVKNALLFDNVQAPHYNYVGDSVLGYKAHMGAGVIASNFKNNTTPINLLAEGEKMSTGLRKMGVMLGDYADIGCNSVLFPGTVVGKYSRVYPLTRVRGTVPERTIVKSETLWVEMTD